MLLLYSTRLHSGKFQQLSLCCIEYEYMMSQITSGYAGHWGNSENHFTSASEVPPVIRYAAGLSGMPAENILDKAWSTSGTRRLAYSRSILARSHLSRYASSQSTSHDCLQASEFWSLHPTQFHIWQVWEVPHPFRCSFCSRAHRAIRDFNSSSTMIVTKWSLDRIGCLSF